MKQFLLDQFGFPAETIVETKEGFTVQGDILFEKADFWARYRPTANQATKHYRSQYKVNQAVVNVYINTSVPSAWKTAFRSAFSNWNSLNLGLKFNEVNSTPVHGVTVTYASLGRLTEIQAQTTGFPSEAGYPANTITVNATYGNSLVDAQRLFTAVHELGHTIGFMHTDVAATTQVLINPVNSPCNILTDYASVMHQGPISFAGFSTCDKSVFKATYP